MTWTYNSKSSSSSNNNNNNNNNVQVNISLKEPLKTSLILSLELCSLGACTIVGLIFVLWVRYAPLQNEIDISKNATIILRRPEPYGNIILNNILLTTMIPLNMIFFFPMYVFFVVRVKKTWIVVLCCVFSTLVAFSIMWLSVYAIPQYRFIISQAPYLVIPIVLRFVLPSSAQVWLVSLILWIFFSFALIGVYTISKLPSDEPATRIAVSVFVLPIARELASIPVRVMVRGLICTDWLEHEFLHIRKAYCILFPLVINSLLSGLARLMAASIMDWGYNVATILANLVFEIFIRLTIDSRDKFLMRILSHFTPCFKGVVKSSAAIMPQALRNSISSHGSGKVTMRASDAEATSLLILAEMIGEYMGIFTSTLLVPIFLSNTVLNPFQAYQSMDNPFDRATFDYAHHIGLFVAMLLGELLTDFLCITYEITERKLPLSSVFKAYRRKSVLLAISLASIVSCTGMILGTYASDGTSAACSGTNLCYCVDTSSMRAGSIREKYCKFIYPETEGHPPGIQALFIEGYHPSGEWTLEEIDFTLIKPLYPRASLSSFILSGQLDTFSSENVQDTVERARNFVNEQLTLRLQPATVIFALAKGGSRLPAVVAINGSLCDDTTPVVVLQDPTVEIMSEAIDMIMVGQNLSAVLPDELCPAFEI